jgi:hypothetical protein
MPVLCVRCNLSRPSITVSRQILTRNPDSTLQGYPQWGESRVILETTAYNAQNYEPAFETAVIRFSVGKPEIPRSMRCKSSAQDSAGN